MRDDSGLHLKEEDLVFCLPLVPTLQSTDSAPLSQGVFPQAESLDRNYKAALCPLGNSSFMFFMRPDSGLSNLFSPGKTSFSAKVRFVVRTSAPHSR